MNPEPTNEADGDPEETPDYLLGSGILAMILATVAFWLAHGMWEVTYTVRENHGLSESMESLARGVGVPVYNVMADVLAGVFFFAGIVLVLVSLKILLDSIRWNDHAMKHMDGDTSALETALEKNGVDVDSTLNTGMDISLMYEYDPDDKLRDLATVALVYARVPHISQNVLSVTPIDTSGESDERVANYGIERELAEQFAADELSKEEYIESVRDTWEEFDG